MLSKKSLPTSEEEFLKGNKHTVTDSKRIGGKGVKDFERLIALIINVYVHVCLNACVPNEKLQVMLGTIRPLET